ncbi:Ribokinase-like protein [Phlegmacium glaucopus]|nr:Ribokinase-like protein [Phlegmacium glaucopus]
MTGSTCSVFFMGNPLLDMQVMNGEKLLDKYGLKADDAILAEEKHFGLYDELVNEHQVTYVAGGAAQNAARGAAYVLPPKSVVCTGAVGDDALAEKLKEANKREGLDQVYQVEKGGKTGACAVIITGHLRSLVANLRVADKFDKAHLSSPEVAPVVESAKFYYMDGYFLTHGVESALELGRKSATAGKTFVMNLSAPFVPQYVLPHTDIIIGNESEAKAWASATGLPGVEDLPAIARSIALLPKSNPSRPRIVIFTQGAHQTVMVASDKPDSPKAFPVNPLEDSQIVDTNGAGDAFAGGFVGALVAGKNLDDSVLAGHALARACVQQVGPQYPWPKVNIL